MGKSDAMLIYKAWLETRWRFLAAMVLLAGISVYTVVRAPVIIQEREQFRQGEHILYAQYIWILLYKGYLQTLWILSAVMLGLGGLWREKASGSAGFTLSLPVTRRRLVLMRAFVGAAEVIVLALVPSLLIWMISPLSGNSYPLGDALLHTSLMVGGGLLFYVWGVLLSHLMQGEFSTPALGLSACMALYILFHVMRLETFNPFDLMSGKYQLDPATFLMRSALPWLPLGVFAIVAALAVLTAVKVAEARDF